jgi:putative transposase
MVMTKFQNKYRIQSTRLPDWDYSTPAYYYLTICTHHHQPSFGRIVDNDITLTPLGEIGQRYWDTIPQHFPNVELDEFIIMPNHIHGIVFIQTGVETQHAASLPGERVAGELPPPLKPGSLPVIVRSYKSAVTR